MKAGLEDGALGKPDAGRCREDGRQRAGACIASAWTPWSRRTRTPARPILTKAAAEAGATKTASGIVIKTHHPGHRRFAGRDGRSEGALRRHARERQGVRQLDQARRARDLPAERRDPVLDGSRAADEGRRQGAASCARRSWRMASAVRRRQIRPNNTLIFQVELLDIVKPDARLPGAGAAAVAPHSKVTKTHLPLAIESRRGRPRRGGALLREGTVRDVVGPGLRTGRWQSGLVSCSSFSSHRRTCSSRLACSGSPRGSRGSSGLLTAILLAIFVYRMPVPLALNATAYGAAFGLFPDRLDRVLGGRALPADGRRPASSRSSRTPSAGSRRIGGCRRCSLRSPSARSLKVRPDSARRSPSRRRCSRAWAFRRSTPRRSA